MIHYCGPKSWLSISAARGKNQPQLQKADNQYHIHLTLKTVLFSLSVLGGYHTGFIPHLRQSLATITENRDFLHPREGFPEI